MLKLNKSIAAAILFYIFVTAVFVGWSYRSEKSDLLREIDNKLFYAASAIEYVLAEDFHERALDKDSIQASEDEINIKNLSALCNKLGLEFLYTVVQKEGKFYITSSSAQQYELDKGEEVRYFTPYDDASDALKASFDKSEMTVEEYEDRWGRFRSVFLPLKTKEGKKYIAGAEINITYLHALLEQRFLRSLAISLFFFFPAVLLVIAYNRTLLKEMKFTRNVVDTIEDYVFYKDKDLKYSGCNEKFRKLCNKEWNEIIGKKDKELFNHATARVFGGLDQEVLEKGVTLHKYDMIVDESGREIYLSILKSPIKLDGKISGIVCSARDYSEQHRLDTQLKELNKNLEMRVEEKISEIKIKDEMLLTSARQAAMGEMISMIAHQWRQPLAAINAAVGNIGASLALGDLDTKNLEQMLGKVEEYTYFLSQTIDNFRNFFSPKQESETLDMEGVFARVTSMIGKSLENNNIALIIENDSKKRFRGYGNELMQVFLNIINNSKDAIKSKHPTNPFIKIVIRDTEESIITSIEDNGGGIKEEYLERVFEPYFTTKEAENGTGLGLYMCKMVVEMHSHGAIKAQNTDVGAKFIVEIPLELKNG